ncbi:hypothetical protein LI073_01945 [bacterium 210917-SL.2.15]|nr:hypothetical protein [bacterium 210917-SL.2.15]
MKNWLGILHLLIAACIAAAILFQLPFWGAAATMVAWTGHSFPLVVTDLIERMENDT